jgi:acyl-CoA hydrolase
VDFTKPVYVGDVVRFKTKTLKTGRSSVLIEVTVEAERFNTHDRVVVTTAKITMISVNEEGKSIPFDSPPTVGEQGLNA